MIWLIIDLFAGMGGWTQSFLNDPRFNVFRYDNDPWLSDIEHMNMIDLSKEKVHNFDITRHRFLPVKLLIGSPPCYEFSNAYSAPKIIAKREGREFIPDMTLVESFLEHVERLQPEFWLMENVIGSIPFIEPILGPPRQIIGPFVLWGNFPLLDLSIEDMKKIRGHKKEAGDKHRWSDHRASYRAFIPEPMSRAIKRNITAPTLKEWIQ